MERDFARSCEILAEVMKVCSPISLCESLQLIIEMPEMCDVTFLVGPEETPVHGLKAVLSVRSRYVDVLGLSLFLLFIEFAAK